MFVFFLSASCDQTFQSDLFTMNLCHLDFAVSISLVTRRMLFCSTHSLTKRSGHKSGRSNEKKNASNSIINLLQMQSKSNKVWYLVCNFLLNKKIDLGCHLIMLDLSKHKKHTQENDTRFGGNCFRMYSQSERLNLLIVGNFDTLNLQWKK